MESGNIDAELDRFAKKAEGYKAAINLAPSSRCLECIYIIGVVDGYVRKYNLDRRELVVLDLMSGSGFLSQAFFDAGFRNIHGIEVCQQMSNGAEVYKQHAKLHWREDILSIGPLLSTIKPDVIASLASFHHLIVRSAEGTINVDDSVKLQERLFRLCAANLHDGGILVVADIFEDALLSDSVRPCQSWKPSRSTGQLAKGRALVSLRKKLGNSDSLQSFSESLSESYGIIAGRNPAIRWFRDVVSPITSVGHDDVALSEKLVRRLAENLDVTSDVVACPWIFENELQLRSFILKKFGFDIDHGTRISDDEVMAKAMQVVGVETKGSILTFSWKLALITLLIPLSKDVAIYRLSTIWLLGMLNASLAILIILKAAWLFDVRFQWDSAANYFFFAVLGAVIGRVVEWISKHRR